LRWCSTVFGEERIFILSNRPVPVRADYFHRVFPGIRFVSGVRKKPFPDGLLRIMELSGAVPGQVVMLDDRLLTGVLGACLAGVGVIYITAPYVSLAHRPLHESFFMLLRILERGFITLVNRLPENL
jgi:predicted HAD superfamily phosphohydrolase YqeG